MMNEALLSQITPESAQIYAETLTTEDIAPLVERLSSPEDKIRYPAFLLLRARSATRDDVLPFWDLLAEKLNSSNSYQRSIGGMLLAANARWDTTGRMRNSLDSYLSLLQDEKPITVRQSIQALPQIISADPSLTEKITTALLQLNLMRIKETMRKLVLTDIVEVLLCARAVAPSAVIDEYLFSALNGAILDEKTKRQLRTKL